MYITKELVRVNDYCSKFNLSTLHPLVSVHDLSEGTWEAQEHVDVVRYHFYGIFLKQGEGCILKYGRQNYDYQDGTLVFLGPGQLVNVSKSIRILNHPAMRYYFILICFWVPTWEKQCLITTFFPINFMKRFMFPKKNGKWL